MRGQFYFRDQGTTGDGAAVVGGVGTLEAPEGLFAENTVRGVLLGGGPDSFVMTPTSYAVDLSSGEFADHVAAAEIDAAARLPVWPLPSPLAGDVVGGGLMLRRTRMPARAGHEIFACLAVLKAPAERLARDVMFQVEGGIDGRWEAGRLAFLDPKPVPELVARGTHLHQLLKQPVWGFGSEGLAFHSTLTLSDIDLCEECLALTIREDLRAEELERLAALRAGPIGYVFAAGERDPEYLAFREAMVEAGGRAAFDGVSTAAQIAAREEAAGRIAAEILRAREGGGPRP